MLWTLSGTALVGLNAGLFGCRLVHNGRQGIEMYGDWEQDLQVKADDSLDGWNRLTQLLSEDEEWARIQFEAFHGREY
jgi:hypothetical protein